MVSLHTWVPMPAVDLISHSSLLKRCSESIRQHSPVNLFWILSRIAALFLSVGVLPVRTAVRNSPMDTLKAMAAMRRMCWSRHLLRLIPMRIRGRLGYWSRKTGALMTTPSGCTFQSPTGALPIMGWVVFRGSTKYLPISQWRMLTTATWVWTALLRLYFLPTDLVWVSLHL